MTSRGFSRKTCLRLAALILVVAGCRDTHDPDPDPDPFLPDLIVSNPRGTSAIQALGLVAPFVNLTYASLPPGTIPDGRNITIVNRRTGATAGAAIVAGGVDPIAIAAEIGDTLDISIALTGDRLLPAIAIVPARRPPVVVRTDPPPGKRDVPLNSIIRLVFSEPLARATLTGGSVQLLLNGLPVLGTLAFEDAADLVVSFTPAQPLAAGATYTIAITQGIQDVSGDPLPQAVTVPFTTGPAGTNVGIYLASSDGSNPVWLVRGNRPAWSPDGQRLAFDRDGVIYLINADGSGETPLTPGMSPAWSPAGDAIVFADGTGISTIHIDGSGLTQLIAKDDIASTLLGIGKPAWSPDGNLIAFEHFGDGGDFIPHQAYLMNADGSGAHPVSIIPGGGAYAESDPSWTPDGTRLIFWSYGFGLTMGDLSGGNIPVYQNDTLFAYGANPSMSVNDQTIVFNGYPDGSRWGQPDAASLFTIGRSVGLRTLITNAYDGAWSADGARIAFVRGVP